MKLNANISVMVKLHAYDLIIPGRNDLLNSSPPGQNGCHFADDMFKHIFLNENIWIKKKSLKYIPSLLMDEEH